MVNKRFYVKQIKQLKCSELRANADKSPSGRPDNLFDSLNYDGGKRRRARFFRQINFDYVNKSSDAKCSSNCGDIAQSSYGVKTACMCEDT